MARSRRHFLEQVLGWRQHWALGRQQRLERLGIHGRGPCLGRELNVPLQKQVAFMVAVSLVDHTLATDDIHLARSNYLSWLSGDVNVPVVQVGEDRTRESKERL